MSSAKHQSSTSSDSQISEIEAVDLENIEPKVAHQIKDTKDKKDQERTSERTMLQIWIDGKFVPQDQASVSVFDHGVLYGDGCFEGIRVYNHRIFKLESHLKRLFRSAKSLRLDIPYNYDELAQVLKDGVAINNITDGYIRPVVTRGYGNLGLNPFQCKRACVYVITANIQLYPPELYKTGMKVVVAERLRVDRKALDPSVKSLNYLNNIMAKVESIDAGVLEAIMLNHDGYVSECTGDNIFGIKDGKVYTPPVSAGILEGITRNFVIEMCNDLKIPCEEKLFYVDELKQADECFLTGTAAEIMSVTHIDEQQIGTGKPGDITNKLLAEFRRRTNENAPED